jgi:hypothetical protein
LRTGLRRRTAFRHGHRGEIAAPGNPGDRLRAGQRRRRARSLASGQIEPGSEKYTIADGLRATHLSPRTFSILRERVDRILLVTEEEILQSMRLITEHLRSTVEPSGAVAASPALHRQIEGEDCVSESFSPAGTWTRTRCLGSREGLEVRDWKFQI